jgi:hypothetical protein
VALSGQGEALLGECKWGAVNSRHLAHLRESAKGFSNEVEGPLHLHFALFSGREPADAKLRRAIDMGVVLHFGLEDLR